MKKIIKKEIFKIEFELASALAIGSGENQVTDKDIIVGSDGKPYIPASAIAGVCKRALSGEDYKEYFGYMTKAEKGKENLAKAVESSIIFYDALLNDSTPVISVRDSVALDEYKTAKPGAKFDMEVLEPGVKFVTYVEQSFEKDNDPEIAMMIAKAFADGDIYFGGKTSRGYGAIKAVKVWKYEVCFNGNEDGITDWINASITDTGLSYQQVTENDFSAISEKQSVRERKITISLTLQGGISIRRYTTEASSENETVPDFTQLTLSGGSEKPVIPGTSWAGAFMHQIRMHLGAGFDEREWNSTFGVVKGSVKQKSKIRFSESVIEESTSKKLSRNAIDRFTGGTKDGALFTEITCYGGNTTLEIGIPADFTMPEKIAQAFAASILDLHYGFMAVGGETSIGRGLFTVDNIEGIKSIKPPKEYDKANCFYKSVLELIHGKKVTESGCGKV